MDPVIADATQVISTVGFPIAACVGMFYLYNKTITSLTEAITSMNHVLGDLKTIIIDDLSVRKEELDAKK